MNRTITLRTPAPLDPGFQPAALCNYNYVNAAKASGQAAPLVIGQDKTRAVAAAVEGPITAMNPASALQQHPQVTVCLDEAAASELEMKDCYQWVYDHKPDWQEI